MTDNREPHVFSIVIPAWNAEAFLSRAIESVLAQDYTDFELIIVDDGSTDGTLRIGEEYAQKYGNISVYSKPNGGTSSALELGFSKARAGLFVVLDADDEFDRRFLSSMIRHIEQNPDYDIFGQDLLLVHSDGAESRFFGWQEKHRTTLEDMLAGDVIPGGGTIFRRKVYQSIGGYRQDLRRVEDIDFWMRALLAGFKHVYLPEVLYRYHQGAQGRKSLAVIEEQESRIRVLLGLVAGGGLSASQTKLALEGVARCETVVRGEKERPFYDGMTRDEALHKQMGGHAESLRRALVRFVPRILIEPILGVVGWLAWLVRPIRLLVSKRSVERSRRDDSKPKS